jgi:hypothetical protein
MVRQGQIGDVERCGCGAVCVVEDEGDFGRIPPWPIARAGKDDVVHARSAHGLVGIFAHDPAHGFDQVGFATPVRPDNAGEPRLHDEDCFIAEGFETVQPEALKFHGFSPAREGYAGELPPTQSRGGGASPVWSGRRACIRKGEMRAG